MPMAEGWKQITLREVGNINLKGLGYGDCTLPSIYGY